MAKRCGQRSCNAWAGLTGKHKHRAFPSWWQSLLASTGSLEENMLPLLWYWISLRVKKDWMLFKFWSVTSHFLFSCEMQFSMELVIRRCRPMQCPLLRSIFRSFIGFWVKIWHRNKTACSESNPVQSSRSKSTTCPVVGRLLRFESNSTVITDGCAKAWKRCMAWFWIDSNQTLQPNRSQKKCYVWKQCIDQHWQDELRFSTWRGFVFRNLPL